MKISKKQVKCRSRNETIKKNHEKSGQRTLDQFLIKEKIEEDSLTLSDFECDSVDLDLTDIVNEILT